MSLKNYYRVLSVSEDATHQQIKKAYRRLAYRYHPDRNKRNPYATEKMKELNEAYSVLGNPQKRRQYDALRHQHILFIYMKYRQDLSGKDIFRDDYIDRIFNGFAASSFGFGETDRIFRDFYYHIYRTIELSIRGSLLMFFPFLVFNRESHR
ncbi:MAG TPA: DnaJ domain-containing protein [Thermodesulfobacteriota bacterium]|nr:DnaJ domain-containing protein [Thermodesulfobacteriota bacterium]